MQGNTAASAAVRAKYDAEMAINLVPAGRVAKLGGGIGWETVDALGAGSRGTKVIPWDTVGARADGDFGYLNQPVKAVPDAASLVPRIDVTSDFSMKLYKDGLVTLKYGDPEGVAGLIVNVDKNGILGFDVRASNNSFNPSGTDMFISAMQRLDQEGIQVNAVRGAWVGGAGSVNTAEYLSNLTKGLSPTQAAANTWTGRIAAKYGFTSVQAPESGMFNDITTVVFKKP